MSRDLLRVTTRPSSGCRALSSPLFALSCWSLARLPTRPASLVIAAMLAPRLLVRGVCFAAFVFLSVATAAPAPRPLVPADFDAWRTVGAPQLTRDGKWLAYSFMPQDADGEVIARELATGRELRIPVGTLPAPASAPPDENTNPEAPPTPRTIRLLFTSDGRFLIANTHPPKADVLAARKAKKKPEEMPRDGLVIVDLASGPDHAPRRNQEFRRPGQGRRVARLPEGGQTRRDQIRRRQARRKIPGPRRSGRRLRFRLRTLRHHLPALLR